jgi:hypothetical protein
VRQAVLGLAALLLVALSGSGSGKPSQAAAQPQIINNDRGPDIAIPPGSPVKFDRFDESGEAHFTGQFVITGTFEYWCEIGDCGPDEQPLADSDLMLSVFPDPEISARLPHWVRGDGPSSVDWNEIEIEINNGEAKLVRAVVSPQKHAALIAGKVPRVQGRVSIVADHFVAGFSCDFSPYYSADFIRFAKPAEMAEAKVEGPDGCP